ncbi:MAG: mechanosensitive ion channel family protein [Anaerolineae bacterium]|nr:mechanosensitive ion channel family protein [Anaerolineae bacterium]
MKKRLLIVILAPILLLVAVTAITIGVLRAANINDIPIVESIVGTSETARTFMEYFPLVRFPLQLVFVVIVFLLAWLVSRISYRLAGWLLRAARYDVEPAVGDDEIAPGVPESLAARRRVTVQQLVAGIISAGGFTVALILSAGQFFSLSNMAIVATVAANAFGFAARDYIGDLLNGISNIFENRFNVGDNVSIFRTGDKIEGVIERLTVRMLSIRTRGGELVNVPQGEVRILLNYSRGSYSGVDVICKVSATDLPRAMAELQDLAVEAPGRLPECIEPWKLIARDGTLGAAAEIRIHARAQFGYGAGLRLRIMILVEERLREAGISLVN